MYTSRFDCSRCMQYCTHPLYVNTFSIWHASSFWWGSSPFLTLTTSTKPVVLVWSLGEPRRKAQFKTKVCIKSAQVTSQEHWTWIIFIPFSLHMWMVQEINITIDNLDFKYNSCCKTIWKKWKNKQRMNRKTNNRNHEIRRREEELGVWLHTPLARAPIWQ